MQYLFLQNTIAPYRTSLFNGLYGMGLDIRLLYMCELEKERSWAVDYNDFHYPYYVDKGFYLPLKNYSIHWNPKLVRMMRKEENSVIILGGTWNDLNVIAMCILKRLGLVKQEIVFWSEANYLTNGSRKKSLFRDWLRSFVYNSGEGRIIVPGKMAELTFDKWNIRNKRFVRLPNVIQEDIILESIQENRFFTPLSEAPHFVLPVRLNEKVKGIMNFFIAIGRENVLAAYFDVLGDGDDERRIREFIQENGYDEHIRLRGFCNMNTVVSYYAKSDALILPSFSDPSPLSLVEACCSRLPLLASERCGNHYETVVVGENGYLFNPDDHKSIKRAYESFMAKRKDWPVMGRFSFNLFETYFRQKVALRSFIQQIQFDL